MLEIIAIAVMLIGADADNDKLIKNAYNDLGNNNKVERIEKKICDVTKKMERTTARYNYNPKVVTKSDFARKEAKMQQQMIKYKAQLEIAKAEQQRDSVKKSLKKKSKMIDQLKK